jgi:hypothetical protein
MVELAFLKKTIAACPASFGRSFLSYLAKKNGNDFESVGKWCVSN